MSVNADKLVRILPRIIGGGTPGLTFAGLVLTESDLPPAGRVAQFSSAQAVGAYFGLASEEYAFASQYFQGYVNSTSLPDKILFARYNAVPVAAWLRGAAYTGKLSALTTLNSGGMTLSVDGRTYQLSGLDFTRATSFSEVAAVIRQAMLTPATPATAGRLTGAPITTALDDLKAVTAGKLDISIDGAPHSLADLDFSAAAGLNDVATVLGTALADWATVVLAGSALTVTSKTSGASSSVGFAANPVTRAKAAPADLAGALGLTQAAGATSTPGTASVPASGPDVTYSSQTQAFQITGRTTGAEGDISYASAPGSGTDADLSALLNLTEAAGATLSAGMDAQTLTSCLTNVLKYARDWVTFSTVWEPELDGKMELARWCAGYDTRFCYVMWDTDPAAPQNSDASAARQIEMLELAGTSPNYNTPALAAFVMGFAASLNFDETNGRATAAYKRGEGLAITVDDDEEYDQLVANGYNCYADFATASSNFRFYQPGSVTGDWDWLDTYLNAIALKDGLQLNILDLFAAVKSIPYNEAGYAMVRTACLDTITRFLNFGAIRTGVVLSQTQKVTLLSEIGQDVSNVLEQQGWYMLVKDPGATVRARRGTPECKFYYTDGGSIQKIEMTSTAIQ